MGVFAEGVSLSSLAFAANTAPWWGRTVASVGRALAFQLDAPGMYIVRDALAACVAVAGAAATFHAVYHRTELGTAATRDVTRDVTQDARERGGSVSHGHEDKTDEKNVRPSRYSRTNAKPFVTNVTNDESLETTSVAFANTAASSPRSPRRSPFIVWLVAEPLLVPTVASFAAMVTCTHGDAHAPFPHLTRDDDTPCYGTPEAADRALSAASSPGRRARRRA